MNKTSCTDHPEEVMRAEIGKLRTYSRDILNLSKMHTNRPSNSNERK